MTTKDRELITDKALKWLFSDDTGVSSKALLKGCLGYKVSVWELPSDSDDFGRCYRLVKFIPELKELFPKFKSDRKEWNDFLSKWDEFCILFESKNWSELFKQIQKIQGYDH